MEWIEQNEVEMAQSKDSITKTGTIGTEITNIPIRILLIEDSDTDAELTVHEIQKGDFKFMLKRVVTFEDFQKQLEEFNPHLILCDYNLVHYTALDVLDVMRKSHPEIPTIVITGAIGDELAAETMKRGAADYVLKDKMERLKPVIVSSLRLAETERQKRVLREELEAKLIINRNLTRKVEAKTRALQESNNYLQKMSLEITRQAEQLKEAAIEREEFSAMVTHELKTPLVPIIGYSELLLDGTLGPLNDKQKETIQIMNSSAISLSRLISDLLDVRKLELGRMNFEMRDSSSKDLIEQCLAVFRPLAKTKGVTLTAKIEIASEPALILKCDPKRIRQVLDNLVDNAIKFSLAITGNVEVSVRNNDAEDGLVFSVKDNGVGIPKNKQQNIFQKFYQADTSLTRNAGGTGLGLAICKGIVGAHGGIIWFESEPGKGTTFYFSIPRNLQSDSLIPARNLDQRENNVL